MLNVLREPQISEPESDMRLRDAPGITEGRLDVLFCKPSKLKVEDGYNVRDLTTPDALKELDELEALVKEHGVRTPLKVRFDDGAGDIWIVEGHRRLTVVNRLIEKYRTSGGTEGRKIEAVPIIAEAKGTTPIDRDFSLRHSNSGTPLKPLEFANLIYRTIHQRGLSEKDAAKGFGISITVLRNHLGLRAMPEPIKEHVRKNEISATLASRISKNADPVEAEKLIRENLEENKRIKGSNKKNTRTKVTAKTIKRDAPKAKPAPAPTPETPAEMPMPEQRTATIEPVERMTDLELVEGLATRGYHVIKDKGEAPPALTGRNDAGAEFMRDAEALPQQIDNRRHAVKELIDALAPFAALGNDSDLNAIADDHVFEVFARDVKRACQVYTKATGGETSDA